MARTSFSSLSISGIERFSSSIRVGMLSMGAFNAFFFARIEERAASRFSSLNASKICSASLAGAMVLSSSLTSSGDRSTIEKRSLRCSSHFCSAKCPGAVIERKMDSGQSSSIAFFQALAVNGCSFMRNSSVCPARDGSTAPRVFFHFSLYVLSNRTVCPSTSILAFTCTSLCLTSFPLASNGFRSNLLFPSWSFPKSSHVNASKIEVLPVPFLPDMTV